MQGCTNRFRAAVMAALSVTAVFLGGCLSESDSNLNDGASVVVYSDHELTGSVGDGPIVGAAMRVLGSDGELLMEFESDSTAGYEVVVRSKGKHYPLQVHARNGIDLVTNLAPDFELTGVVVEPGKRSIANVNPYSTFAFELARDLSGGLSRTNLQTAEGIVVRAIGGGLTSLAQTGPMSTSIGPDNAAEMVRGAEELGEVVRRTRDSINAFGGATDGDAVVDMLASDLADEVINGRGGPRSNARASAISIMASTAVMLESMAGELHVYGADASSAMQRSIDRIVGGAAAVALEDLAATNGQLDPARRGLRIAEVLSGDPRVSALVAAVDGIRAGMNASLVRSLLPADYRTVSNDMLLMVAAGDDALIAEVNRMATEGADANPANQAPVINGTPAASATVGSLYEFTPNASDPDGDVLSFTGAGVPSWAIVDRGDGSLRGTPGANDVGVAQGITITVSDGEFSSTLGPFSITISSTGEPPPPPPTNSPPTINGQPASTVVEGQRYSFTPSASDDDGDVLSFSAERLPAWLDINPSNGEITGTPSAGDVGTYDGIVISVFDGTDSASLGPFSIEVTAAGSQTGSVTLSWTAPTENTDGSAITDIAGYRLYWGTGSGNYPNSATINNPGVTTYVIEDLARGNYEVVATAFNESGVESQFSNAANFTVD